MLTKLEIFSYLSIGELETMDMEPYRAIMDQHYDKFITFCDNVKDRVNIKTISCSAYLDNLIFDIVYENGITEQEIV